MGIQTKNFFTKMANWMANKEISNMENYYREISTNPISILENSLNTMRMAQVLEKKCIGVKNDYNYLSFKINYYNFNFSVISK